MLTFNRNSWHYWIATKWGDLYVAEQRSDICYYLRQVVLGIFKMIFSGLAATLFGTMMLSGLFHFIGVLLGLIHRPAVGYEVAGIAMVGAIVAIVGIAWLRDKYLNWKVKQYGTGPKAPSFIKTAYRSWKDKVCTLIEFKD